MSKDDGLIYVVDIPFQRVEGVRKRETGAAVAVGTLRITGSPCPPWAQPSPAVGGHPLVSALPASTSLAPSLGRGKKSVCTGRKESEGLQHHAEQGTKDPTRTSPAPSARCL